MKRKNKTYEYETDRETVENVDFEQLLKEFNRASKEKRRNKSLKKNHKR